MCAVFFFLSIPRLFRRHECLFSKFLYIFVFSFCLDDESKHSALSGAEHCSCSFVVVRVLALYVIVGATAASNKCNRCRRRDWEVSPCRCLVNADQAHRILCCPSVVSWSTNVIICPKYFPSRRSILTCISTISNSLNLFVFWFVGILILLGWISRPCVSVLFEILEHFLSCSKELAIMSMWSEKRRFGMQSLFSSLGLMPKPLSFQVSISFSTADRRTEWKRRLLKGSACFVPRAMRNSSLSTSVSTVAR